MMRKRDPARRQLLGNILWCAAVLLLSGVFFTQVLSFAIITGPSMEPTLHDGSVVLVRRLWVAPKPGDIIVTNKNNPLGVSITKRVVAVAGDTVCIRDNTVLVNGVILDEPYLVRPWEKEAPELLLTVPEGQVFVLGDNRDYSVDSREIGCVEVVYVMGRILPFFSIYFLLSSI